MSVKKGTAVSDLQDRAFVCLDVENPVVAWAAARGVLLSARYIENRVDGQALPISLMMASLLEQQGNYRYINEHIIEAARVRFGPQDSCSRLWGMFCFPDLQSSERAFALDSWGSHFKSDNLVEVVVSGIGLNRLLDSNWITHAPRNQDETLDPTKLDWLPRYWAGERWPDGDPIWEIIIDGKLTILGTDVRQRAYETAAEIFPNSKALLEFGRIAAWQGFDLGNISPFLFDQGERWSCGYFMDMTDAEDERFLESLVKHFRDGHAVNHAYLKSFYGSEGDLGRAPDLRPWGFWREKKTVPR